VILEFGRPRAPLEAPPVFGNPEDESFLRNPYVVAGLAVAGAIVLAVIGTIGIGLYPEPFIQMALDAARVLGV